VPHAKSCKKRLITSQARNERNRKNRSSMRSAVKVYRNEIAKKSAEDKAAALSEIYRLLDTQARKGVLPKKRAARLKSRMAAAAAK